MIHNHHGFPVATWGVNVDTGNELMPEPPMHRYQKNEHAGGCEGCGRIPGHWLTNPKQIHNPQHRLRASQALYKYLIYISFKTFME
jgi:hypothetical protein